MRADAAGARTWLIGALALWALLFWILALAGLGSRIERLPADPALLQPLPAVPAPAQERLGPFPQYAAIGERPLFTDDRRPQPFFINAESGEQQNTFDYVLTSVLLTPGLQMAIVSPGEGGEPVRLRIGEAPEAAPAWRLQSVQPRSAVFAGPDGNRTLELRVFDGVGGEAPTAVAPPRANGARAATPSAGTVTDADATAEVVERPPAAVPVPAQPPAAAVKDAAAPMTPDAQVEAIRQRIEARRAQLRRQAQQPPSVPQPVPDESP